MWGHSSRGVHGFYYSTYYDLGQPNGPNTACRGRGAAMNSAFFRLPAGPTPLKPLR
jgi:hypothetical protein